MDLGGVTKNVSGLRLQDWVTTMVRDNRIKHNNRVPKSKASQLEDSTKKSSATRVKPVRFDEPARGTLYDTFSTMVGHQPITSPSAIKIKNGQLSNRPGAFRIIQKTHSPINSDLIDIEEEQEHMAPLQSLVLNAASS